MARDPPPQSPEVYPPQSPEVYPPQKPATYPPPQPEPVQFPPPQPQIYNGHPQVLKTEGIAVGSQFFAPTQFWNSGLFDCANDSENAIITTFIPCVTFGQIAEVVDNGQTSCMNNGVIYCLLASLIAFPCIVSCSYRTKIRNRYGLMETPAPDWVTHCFCQWCALCQEFRELKSRGLDPAIGWQGNMIRNQQMQMQQYPTTTPPMNQTMM